MATLMRSRLSPAVMLLLVAAGCTSEPRVMVSSEGALMEATPEAVSGSVPITITNTGALEIELLEYHYSVQGLGQDWTGRHAGELVLSPGVDRQAGLPVVIRAPEGGWPESGPPDTLECTLSGSLVYIGNGVFDETLAELGWRPSAPFQGSVVLRTAAGAPAGSN